MFRRKTHAPGHKSLIEKAKDKVKEKVEPYIKILKGEEGYLCEKITVDGAEKLDKAIISGSANSIVEALEGFVPHDLMQQIKVIEPCAAQASGAGLATPQLVGDTTHPTGDVH